MGEAKRGELQGMVWVSIFKDESTAHSWTGLANEKILTKVIGEFAKLQTCLVMAGEDIYQDINEIKELLSI